MRAAARSRTAWRSDAVIATTRRFPVGAGRTRLRTLSVSRTHTLMQGDSLDTESGGSFVRRSGAGIYREPGVIRFNEWWGGPRAAPRAASPSRPFVSSWSSAMDTTNDLQSALEDRVARALRGASASGRPDRLDDSSRSPRPSDRHFPRTPACSAGARIGSMPYSVESTVVQVAWSADEGASVAANQTLVRRQALPARS